MTFCSKLKVDVICPFCKEKKKKIPVSYIYCNNGINCNCKDGKSYPNKFAYYLFKSIEDQILNFEQEYSPEWAGRYKYDNYFEKDGKKYIVEMDGGLGHGYKTIDNKVDIEGKDRDIIKTNLAVKHGITVIRIDCLKSQSNYIKNSIINKLSSILDFKNIDWDSIDVNAKKKNIYYDICQYYNTYKNDSLKKFQKT